jgi:arsenate reductase-like glutaredoxin family protein
MHLKHESSSACTRIHATLTYLKNENPLNNLQIIKTVPLSKKLLQKILRNANGNTLKMVHMTGGTWRINSGVGQSEQIIMIWLTVSAIIIHL